MLRNMLEQYFAELTLAFDPNQPRDETGKWSETGAGGAGGAGAEKFRAAQQATPEFREYFGKSQTVDDNGKPLVLKHGTGRVEISNYDPNKVGNNGVAAGKGFYFAESDEIANNFAEMQNGSVQPAYAAIENAFDFDSLFNVERVIKEWPEKVPAKTKAQQDIWKYFAESAREHAASKVNDDEHLTGYALWKHLRNAIGRYTAENNINERNAPLARDPYTWEITGVALVNDVIERLGYDGIVHSAKDMYGSVREFPTDGDDRYGNVWVAFKPTQIKSAIANKGDFKKTESNISLALDLAPYFQELELDCGTGAGGFKSNNTCAKGDGTNNESDTPGTKTSGVQDGRRLSGRAGRMATDIWAEHSRATKPLTNAPGPVNVPGRGKIQFGPVARARQTASAYMRSTGREYNPPTEYVKVDPVRAGKIANEYDRMKHDPENPEVKAAFKAMIDETLAQYQFIKRTGLKIEPIQPGQQDPYALSPRYAQLDVQENNHLWYFPTASGFGSSEHDSDNNPLLAPTSEKLNGKTLLANDVFRIVHDYFGHFKEGHGFRADGEENAWRSHSSMYSPLARRAMTTETRGQNSWVNYGPHGESNRSATSDKTIFADQKTGLLPEWVMNEGLSLASLFLAAEFDESEHPRGHGGKFTNKAKQAEAKAKEAKLWDEVNEALKKQSKANAEKMSPALKEWSKKMDAKHEAHVSNEEKAATFKARYTGTAGFKGFFRESKVVDYDTDIKNEPLEVFHGTLRPLNTFDESESNPESFMGAGLYFSNTPDDASSNYADKTGPDKANTIGRLADALQQQSADDPDRVDEDGEPLEPMDDDEARAEAEKLVGTTPNVIPAYLSMQNPVYFGDPIEGFVKGPNATKWDLDHEPVDPEDEDYDWQPTGKIAEFMTAIRDSIEDFNNGNMVNTQADADQVVQDLQEAFEISDVVTAEKVMKVAHDSEGLMYADQYDQTTGNSKMYASEIIRDALERMGYDGLIDRGVWDRWGKHRNVIGRGFQGMTPETIHYVVWHGTQVKSSRGNKGTFDPNTKRLDLSNFWLELAFDPNQPRDSDGKWTSIGSYRAVEQAESDPDYVYHGTSEENAFDIAQSGLKTHRPSHGTDQDAWPDGATEKRSYWSGTARVTASFLPEGKAALVRVRKDAAKFKQESTGDIYATKPIASEHIEIMGGDGKWYPIRDLIKKDMSLALALAPYFLELAFDPNQPRDDDGKWTETGSGGGGDFFQGDFAHVANGKSTTQNGVDISYRKVKLPSYRGGGEAYQMQAKKGDKRVADAIFSIKKDSSLHPDDLFVEPQFRKQGIATAMHDFLRESTNAKIITPTEVTKEGKAFYEKRPQETKAAGLQSFAKGTKVVNEDGSLKVVYHGSPYAFTEFGDPTKDSYMLDRNLGSHFAEDANVTNTFTIGQYAWPSDFSVPSDYGYPESRGAWYRDKKGEIKYDGTVAVVKDDGSIEPYDKAKHGSTYGISERLGGGAHLRVIPPGGSVYPVYLSIKNPLVIEPEGNEMDQTAIARTVARLVAPRDKQLFVDAIVQNQGINPTEAANIYDTLKAGKEYKRMENEKYTSIEGYVKDFSTMLNGKEFAIRAKKILQDLGYDGIKYRNTSNNEIKGAKNNWTWIAFEPTQIKSVLNKGTFDTTKKNISLALALRQYFDQLGALTLASGFDPNQPRDESGKWTETGAGAGSMSVVTETNHKEAEILLTQGIRPDFKREMNVTEFAPGKGLERGGAYVATENAFSKGSFGPIRLHVTVPRENLAVPQEMKQLGHTEIEKVITSENGAVTTGEVPASAFTKVEVYDLANHKWDSYTPQEYLAVRGIESAERLPSMAEYEKALRDNVDTLFLNEEKIQQALTDYNRAGLKDKQYLASDLPKPKIETPVPAEPGSVSIPEGHIRLFHYTRGKRGEDRPKDMTADEYGTFLGNRLREGGIDISKAVGASYGEPNVVWASAAQPDPGHVFAEFSVPYDDPRLGRFRLDKGTDLREWEKRNNDVFLTESVKPEEILAVHEPWHEKYRYITKPSNERLREEILAGKHERILTEEKYGPAVRKFLKENKNV